MTNRLSLCFIEGLLLTGTSNEVDFANTSSCTGENPLDISIKNKHGICTQSETTATFCDCHSGCTTEAANLSTPKARFRIPASVPASLEKKQKLY